MQEAEKKAAARRECPTMFILWPLPFDEEEGDYGDDFDKKQKYVPIHHIKKNGQGHKIHMR